MIYCKMYFLHDQFTAAQDKPAPLKCTVAIFLLCDWAWRVYNSMHVILSSDSKIRSALFFFL